MPVTPTHIIYHSNLDKANTRVYQMSRPFKVEQITMQFNSEGVQLNASARFII